MVLVLESLFWHFCSKFQNVLPSFEESYATLLLLAVRLCHLHQIFSGVHLNCSSHLIIQTLPPLFFTYLTKCCDKTLLYLNIPCVLFVERRIVW